MRIALCMHGYFLNSGGEIAARRAKKYIDKHILSHGNVDVFFHCWEQSEESHRVLSELYDPVAIQYEKQLKFTEELSHLDQNWFDEGFNRSETDYRGNSIFQSFSVAYSRKQSVKLKSDYEKENNFKYDVVIIARTDLGTRGKEHINEYYATDIKFDPSLDMDKVYLAFWDQTNWGYTDHWFYSSSKNMDVVASLYDKLLDYYKPDSDYVKSVTGGWIHSNAENPNSQELLKDPKDRTENLQKFEKWGCVDNHKLYKWFFYDAGLQDKLVFLEVTNSHLHDLAIVMYSHSDYSDVWPMFFGQADKYLPSHIKRYVITDKDDNIPANWQALLYDDQMSYTERVSSCLEEIDEEYCIFHHEDMPLYQEPKVKLLNTMIGILKSSFYNTPPNPGIDYIKLLKGGEMIQNQPEVRVPLTDYMFHIVQDQYFQFANQPTLWDIDMLKIVYEDTEVEHISEFEHMATEACKQNNIYGAYCYGNEPKRGMFHWDSIVYPYVATAIVKGKWNLTDYPEELGNLLEEYNIDKDIRGTT